MKLKQIILFLALISFSTKVAAQIEDPVTWGYSAKKTGPNEATIFFRAMIENGWHIYSQTVNPGGPVKTTFTINPSEDFTLVDDVLESKPLTKFEKVFNMNVAYFERTTTFQQKIKLNGTKVFKLKGKIEFMACNNTKCLPPIEIEFSIPVK